MMRTTITLDADVAALVERNMKETDRSFKVTVNDALRSALAPDNSNRPPYQIRAFDLGEASMDLTKALQIAGELEDDETLRKLDLGK